MFYLMCFSFFCEAHKFRSNYPCYSELLRDICMYGRRYQKQQTIRVRKKVKNSNIQLVIRAWNVYTSMKILIKPMDIRTYVRLFYG